MRGPYLKLNRDRWYAEFWFRQDGVLKCRWVFLRVTGKKNRSKAEKALRALEVQVAREGKRLNAIRQTLAAWTSEYLGALQVRPSTASSYRAWCTAFSARFAGALLVDITARHITVFQAELQSRYSPASVGIAMRSVRAMIKMAVTRGLIDRDPFVGVAVKRTEKHVRPHWTEDQFVRFMESVMFPHHRAAFGLAFYAGLRRQEIANLLWEDVGTDRIIVASREGAMTKTGRSRTVPLMPQLSPLLEEIRATAGPVIGISGDAISHAFSDAQKAVSMPDLPRISIHGLRHSFATMLAPHIALPTLARILGHSQISTTMIYSHISDDVAITEALRASKIAYNFSIQFARE